MSFFLVSSHVHAQTMELTATADKTDILTGETLVYTFKYKCASTTTNCTNVTLVANSPSGISFPDQTIGLPTDIASYSFSPDHKTITFVFKEPLTAGNTGIIQVTGQGYLGLAEGTPASMTANLLTGATVGSTATINTTLHSSDKFCPKFNSVRGLALDNPTFYSLGLGPETQNGYGYNGIGLTNTGPVTVVQQFAAGTNIQSVTALPYDGSPLPVIPSGACVIDNANAKITCTFPASTMQVTSVYAPRVSIDVTVVYPSVNFSVGSSISDVISVTYQPDGVASPITLTDGNTRSFTDGRTYASLSPNSCVPNLTATNILSAPVSQLKITKDYDQIVKPGQSYGYDFRITNTGNTTLTDVVVEDIIPTGVIATQVYGGNFAGFVGDEVIKRYIKTVSNPTFTEIPAGINYDVPSGEVLTAIKYTFDKIPSGALLQYAGFGAKLDPTSTATSFQNCLTGTASNSGFILDPTSKLCATTTIGTLDPYSTINASKFITQYVSNQYGSFYGGPINPGTQFWNFIILDNLGGGLPLQNPVAMDLLPLGLDYANNITYTSGTPTADVTDIIPNFNGTGRTLVRLKWNSPMPAGTSYGFNILTTVNALAPAGLAGSYSDIQRLYSPYTEIGGIKNTVFFTGSSPKKCKIKDIYASSPNWEAVDLYDLNSNGLTTTDTLCYSTDYVGVTSSAQMSSVKWVKGQCDIDYSKYPVFGQTMPGGLANYKLTVTNIGNVPTKDIQILDILPFVGDAGVIDPNGRLTQWKPNLVTPLKTPADVTVYYSTSSNPCRTDYVTAGPAGCTVANWTSILPQDPTTIQSIKLDFGTKVLKPGDQVELTWEMRAPVTGVTTGDIAWNSFGFKSTRADNNDPFLPSEPFKVGIKLKDNIPGNYGDFVWLDANKNGIQDSGEVGVDGVRVELHKDNGDGINDPKTDPVVAFTSTANGGQYLFPALAVGDYYAVFFLPPGYSTSSPNATVDSNDSDGISTICNGNRVTIVPLTNIASGETDLTWDQGIFPDKAAVGNYVWFDENQNNIQDESSANGINGVKVCLYTSTGTLVATDTTSNDVYGRPGYYLFDQLDPGSYYVQFKPTADKTYTTGSGSLGGSSSDEIDSDVDPATGKTAIFILSVGQVDLTWDTGLIIQTGPYKLGNFVWSDTNNDGKVDGVEVGVNNVTVNLYNDRNNDNKPQPDEFVTTTLTGIVGGIDGIYVFDRLPAGNYIVQIPDANFSGVLKDYISSTGNDPAPAPDDNIENDDNGTAVVGCSIISKPITLGAVAEPLDAGYTNYTVDFGFYKCNKPDYTASVTQPDCTGGKGNIKLSSGNIGDKVGYTIGTTFTGNYASAVDISSLAGGVVVGNIAGSATDVTYIIRVYNGEEACYKDITFTIQALFCCTKPLAGNDQILCAGTSATLTGTSPTTGTWSAQTGNLAGATLSTTSAGIATVNFATTATGTYKFIYNISASCEDTMSIVVNAKPVIANGTATICAGTSVDLTTKITGYASLLNPVWTVATATGTAVSTPTSVSPSATTIYVLVAQNALGCKDTASVVVTVNAKPNAGTDQTLACANASTNTLTTATSLVPVTSGGTFTQIGTNPAVATITGNNVSGMNVAGTYQFQYSVLGCLDTVAVTVSPCAGCVKPDAGADAASVCQPTSTAKLTAVSTGGTWAAQTGNPATATIDATGNIIGLSGAGTYKFIYSVSSGGQTCTDTAQVVVNAKPVIADGTATICAGASVDLTTKITDYASLLSPVWTVSTATGTAVSTPTAVSPSTTTTYVLVAQNALGCKDTANVMVTVNAKPNAGTDQTLACANAATNTLTTTTILVPITSGGTFTQIGTNPAVVTITGNNVSGMSVAGMYQFQYSVLGCLDTVAVTVSPCAGCVKPDAGADATAVCQPVTTAKLTAVTSGGTWAAQAGNPATARIDSTGNITGLSASGTYKFIYSVSSGGQTCTDTAQVVVNAKPVIADGTATICAGASVDLTTKITGYASLLSPVWTISTATGTVVNTPTSVSPSATTTYVLVAQNALGCKDTANVMVTVNPIPTNVTASSNSPVAQGGTINLTSTSTGGTVYTWSGPNSYTSTAQNPAIASATTAMTGTYTVTVTNSGACTATATMLVAITVPPTCTPPTNVNASNNSPVTQSEAINLMATSTGGINYAWSGPNGYNSTLQNPTIASATPAMAGTYTVLVTSSGTCAAAATTLVYVEIPPVDVALKKTVDGTCERKVGDVVTFNVVVSRKDTTTQATAVIVKDQIPAEFLVTSSTATKGTFDALTGLWSGISLAKGDSAVLTVKVTIKSGAAGLLCNEAYVDFMDKVDINSIPGNQNPLENDIAWACVTVPINLCKADGQSVTLTSLDSLANIRWFKDGVELTAEAGKPSITVSDAGSYTYTGTSNGTTCTFGNCCPVIIKDACYGSIGDYVWTDQNNEGQQSSGELPIAGVKVYLYNGAGTVKIDSTITDANGKYLFDSLLTGAYQVKFVAPLGTIPAKQNVGADVTDSDANKLGFSQVVNINTALLPSDTLRNNQNVDAGFVPVGLLGDYVWFDTNKDGLQTTGEPAVKGLKVYLLDGVTGAKLDSTVTNALGKYLFDSLLSGSYNVQFVAPKDTNFTVKGITPTSGLDSNPNVTTGLTDPVTIDASYPLGNTARDNRSVDAGLTINVGSIAGKTFDDNDKSGTQNAGDTDHPGVKVYLYKETTPGVYVKVDSVITDSQGNYNFNNLLSGNYQVQFNKATGLTYTTPNVGDDTKDSDANPADGRTGIININTNLPETDLARNSKYNDAGFIPIPVNCKDEICIPFEIRKVKK